MKKLEKIANSIKNSFSDQYFVKDMIERWREKVIFDEEVDKTEKISIGLKKLILMNI
jgi:hypothetical protein